MSQMLKNFEKLADKYKFVSPISPDIQSYVLQIRKKLLVSILKQQGAYSIYFGAVLTVYFTAKSLKLSLSFTLSKIIVITAAVTMAVLITLSGLYLSSLLKDKSGTAFIHKPQVIEKKDIITKPVAPIIKADYGINEFSGSPKSAKITALIFNELRQLSGNKSITRMNVKNRTQVKKIITGAVRDIGNTTLVTAKIIDVETGKVLFATDAMQDNSEQLNKLCINIAKEIAKNLTN